MKGKEGMNYVVGRRVYMDGWMNCMCGKEGRERKACEVRGRERKEGQEGDTYLTRGVPSRHS